MIQRRGRRRWAGLISDAVDADLIDVQANGVQPPQQAEQYRYVITVADDQSSFLIVTGASPSSTARNSGPIRSVMRIS